MPPDIDFAAILPEVVAKLKGEPNRALSTSDEIRYGSRGSFAVNPQKGTWFDHEAGEGGGVLDLIARELNLRGAAAISWLEGERIIDPRTPVNGSNGATRPGATAAPRPKIVATYDYVDEHGELIFQVVRLEPKDFRQRRPDGRGGWDWTIKGSRMVPYRLPDLLARPDGAPIYIVEGEKDVDRLRGLGLCATANAGGSGKWPDGMSDHFAGAEVVVIPDNDDPGRKHAARIVDALKDVAARVDVVTLPGLNPKGDVSDWLDAGGTADKLARMVEALKAPDICEFMEVIAPGKIEPKTTANWRIKGMIPKKGVGAIYGPSGEGKTFVTLDLGMSMARGTPWRGRKAERTAVLYLSPDGGEMVQNRIVAYCQRHGIATDDHSLFLAPRPIDLLNRGGRHGKDGTTAVVATIERIEAAYGVEVGVVMIDTASRVMPGGDENAAKDVTRFIDNMAAIAGEGERAVIAVHHTPKSDSTVLRGHSALHGACDFELNVADRQITVAKQRDGESGQVLGFDLAVEEIGFDEDGEPVTSCVAVEADAAGRVPRDGFGRMSPPQVIALKALENLIAERGKPLPCGGGFPSSPHNGIPVNLVLETLRGSIFHEREPQAARKAWERMRDRLNSLGIIGVRNGWLWIPKKHAS